MNTAIAVLPGKHQVSIRRDGVVSPMQAVTIAEGDTAEITIELSAPADVKPSAKGHEVGPPKISAGHGAHTGQLPPVHAPSRLWPGDPYFRYCEVTLYGPARALVPAMEKACKDFAIIESR